MVRGVATVWPRYRSRRLGPYSPWTFYGLTEEGLAFLEEYNLLAAEETFQRIYETISDKPEKMI